MDVSPEASMESQIHDSAPPAALLNALERRNANLRYTDAKAVYFCLGLWGEACCGVFGDGDNAAYEWFVWQDGKLETSDCAYGSSTVALRDALIQVEGYPDAVRHAASAYL
jgi:hypothetical protein